MRTPNGSNHSLRFNPFNDDFSTSTENDDDTAAASTTSELTSTTSEGSGDVSLAELGLTEDYFSHPEGLFGMSSAEELEAAIENCKKMVLEAREHSERKKKLVNRLIQLRMKLQELKEGPSEIEPKVKLILGHRLKKKTSNSVKYYCDCCNGLIWGMLQTWYRCKECSFNCHYKCANNIRRKCISVDLKNKVYKLCISPEKGLSAQQFICMECKNPILITGTGKDEARLCDYSGWYFCPQCHWNDMAVVPARVVHNWDFTPQKVSRQSLQILTRMYKKPLLNIQEINPALFNYVEELADIRKLRQDILLMKEYFVTCNSALESKLLLKLRHRQHFVENSDIYSLEDLVLTHEQTLSADLTKLHAEYAKHIKFDCISCQAKGFICEVCKSGEPLFPFDFGVSSCVKCKAVFHRDCFTFTNCPRCKRLRKKKERKSENIADEAQSESDGSQSDTDFTTQRKNSDESSEVSNWAPVFSPTMSEVQFKEQPQSPAIEIDPSTKRRHGSSLRNILTESSYTDYAILGFTGAGKGRQSVPDIPALDRNKKFSKGSSTTESDKPNIVAVNVSRAEGEVRHKEQPRMRFKHSQNDQERYEANPITRRSQRDEAMFNSLVEVGDPKQRGRSSRQGFEQRGNQWGENQPPGAIGSRLSKININDPFNLTDTKGSKFITGVTRENSRRADDMTSGPSTNFDFFNQHRSKGSKFIDEAARNSRLTKSPESIPTAYDSFRAPQTSRPQKRSPTPEESPNLAPIPLLENHSRQPRYASDFKQLNQAPNYSRGNPFGEDDVRGIRGNPFGEDDEHKPPSSSSSYPGGNPFGEDDKEGNPFEVDDDYDEEKNPFS